MVALVVKTFLFQAFYIPSASMEPTLSEGDRVLVNKVSYDVHDVNRGDVIVFELDEEDVGPDGIKDLIKRVVGLPGDVIESRDGVVYVNDRALEEPYLAEGTITGDPQDSRNPAIARQTVPEGHVFVLGDNRSNSADSRYPYRNQLLRCAPPPNPQPLAHTPAMCASSNHFSIPSRRRGSWMMRRSSWWRRWCCRAGRRANLIIWCRPR